MEINRRSTSQADPAELRLGLLYGVLAYGSWGLVPIYFKHLKHVPAINVLGHRIVWSVAVLLIPIAIQHRWEDVRDCFRSRRKLAFLSASTLTVGTNWFTFIWAVSHDQILQSSLGYFMNPL